MLLVRRSLVGGSGRRFLSSLVKELRLFNKEELERAETALEGSFKDFDVHHEEGTMSIELKKQFQNETVVVKADIREHEDEDDLMPPQDQDQDNEMEQVHEAPGISIRFEVMVSKDDTSDYLIFDCIKHGEQSLYDLNSISIINPDEEGDDEMYNTQPVFRWPNELSESFYDYLEERGIDNDMMDFLEKASETVDAKESAGWAQRVETFVVKK